MYSVKVELDKNNVCFGCLSSTRQITPLKTHVDLFYILLEHQQIFNTKMLLCWECKTLLHKTWKFQQRIQQAQCILQETLSSMETWKNLSTLSITRKDSYDHIIEYDENKPKPNEGETGNPEIPVEPANIIEDSVYNENSDLNVKDELDDEMYDDMKLENDYPSTDEVSDSRNDSYETLGDIKDDKYIADYLPHGEKKSLNNKNYYEAYRDKVTITNADIDVDELKKYCVQVNLKEIEIEELLERENNEIRQGMRRERPYQCKDCKNAYKRELDYKRHITFSHINRSGKLKCKQCKRSCITWQVLEKHWLQHHNRYYRCTICSLTMQRSTAVIYHIETAHSKKYICNECSDQSSNMKEFRSHYKAKHERLICDDCGKSFIKKRSLETHYKRHHLPPTCEVCNKTYAQYHNLDNHYRLNHPEYINCENRQELAYCVECNKQFPSVYKYRRHLTSAAVHTPPKVEVVPCPECGKVFSRKIRMTNHVMSVHRKNTKHRCDICNKTFCSAYSAKTHRQCVHEKVPMPKNKFCDICGRGFSTNRILANHRRTHTGERPYSCPHCPATFAQRVAMNTHAKTQHKNLVLDASNQVIDSGISP